MTRHVSDRFVAVLDANVLYPFLVRDILLSFAHAGLYRARWSQRIMDEWTSHLLARKPDKATAIRRTAQVMIDEFPEAVVDGYDDLVSGLTLPDPDDRHVLAAAIKVGAHCIVTENTRDFPQSVAGTYDIEVLTADQFVLSTIELYESEAIDALRAMRQRYRNPSHTVETLHVGLIKAGLVRTAAELTPHIDRL